MKTMEVQRTGFSTPDAPEALPKKQTVGSGIESTDGHCIFSTRPGSSSGLSVRSNDTRHIAMSVSAKQASAVKQVLPGKEVDAPSMKPTFAQRWPRLLKAWRVAAAVVAFPLLLAVNTVAIPLVYLGALCSRAVGDGSLADSLGKNWWVRKLWGEDFAHRLATDDIPQLLMVASFVLPGLIPLQSLFFSAQRAMEVVEGRTIGFTERERDAPTSTYYDKCLKDQGVDTRRYRFRDGEWRPAW